MCCGKDASNVSMYLIMCVSLYLDAYIGKRVLWV